MRSNNATSDSCNTAHKDHSTPALVLHLGHTQLSEEICGATVDAPRPLEAFDGDVLDRLHPGLPAC